LDQVRKWSPKEQLQPLAVDNARSFLEVRSCKMPAWSSSNVAGLGVKLVVGD
jgi:hypothetical protein